MFKKLLTLIISCIILFAMQLPVFAADEPPIIHWERLSELTGVPAYELELAYNEMDENDFNIAISELEKAMESYKTLNIIESRAAVQPMSDSDWRIFRNSMRDGAILITQDSATLGYQHGHTSIISGLTNASASDPIYRTIYMTEHPGSTTNMGSSWRVQISNSLNSYWRTRENVATMYHKNSTAIMDLAGQTARSGLVIGYPYNPLANKNDTDKYNCSSLVYRCYIEHGVDIGTNGGTIVLPIHIAQDNDLRVYYRYGNYAW